MKKEQNSLTHTHTHIEKEEKNNANNTNNQPQILSSSRVKKIEMTKNERQNKQYQ